MRREAVSCGFVVGVPMVGNRDIIVRKIEIVPQLADEEVMSEWGKSHQFRHLVANPHPNPRLRQKGRGEVPDRLLLALSEWQAWTESRLWP
jgi:hypothetical protein